jgi:adenine phosphoribosyltransferase
MQQSTKALENTLKGAIRDVPDFPKQGIIFKDITTLLAQGKLLRKVVDAFYAQYKTKKVTKVLGIESRGFIFGTPLAYKLGAGMVPVRKKGKLPYKTISANYELEYGTDTLEVHIDGIKKGEKVLIVDDLLATGGTAKAVAELVKKSGGQVVGFAFVVELGFLNGRKKLKGHNIFSLVGY